MPHRRLSHITFRKLTPVEDTWEMTWRSYDDLTYRTMRRLRGEKVTLYHVHSKMFSKLVACKRHRRYLRRYATDWRPTHKTFSGTVVREVDAETEYALEATIGSPVYRSADGERNV